MNAVSVAEEEQEEMRSAFADGCDCPKLSGTAVTVGCPGEIAERVIKWMNSKKLENIRRGEDAHE